MGLGLGDSSLNLVELPIVITYLILLSCLRVGDGKSFIDACYGQKIYICTKRLHYLSQCTPPTQTSNALNQQIPRTVLWLHRQLKTQILASQQAPPFCSPLNFVLPCFPPCSCTVPPNIAKLPSLYPDPKSAFLQFCLLDQARSSQGNVH